MIHTVVKFVFSKVLNSTPEVYINKTPSLSYKTALEAFFATATSRSTSPRTSRHRVPHYSRSKPNVGPKMRSDQNKNIDSVVETEQCPRKNAKIFVTNQELNPSRAPVQIDGVCLSPNWLDLIRGPCESSTSSFDLNTDILNRQLGAKYLSASPANPKHLHYFSDPFFSLIGRPSLRSPIHLVCSLETLPEEAEVDFTTQDEEANENECEEAEDSEARKFISLRSLIRRPRPEVSERSGVLENSDEFRLLVLRKSAGVRKYEFQKILHEEQKKRFAEEKMKLNRNETQSRMGEQIRYNVEAFEESVQQWLAAEPVNQVKFEVDCIETADDNCYLDTLPVFEDVHEAETPASRLELNLEVPQHFPPERSNKFYLSEDLDDDDYLKTLPVFADSELTAQGS